jgi:hypothetical protein
VTGFDVVAALIWAVAAYLVADRLASALEAFASQPVPDDPMEVEVPDDLVALAAQQSEAWAVEDMLKAMRERYVELRDWNRVRAAFNIGEMPQ